MGFILGIGLIYLIGIIVIIAAYVITIIWGKEILKTVDYENEWFILVPFLNMYAIADIAFPTNNKKYKINGIKIEAPAIAFKIYGISLIVLTTILDPFIGSTILNVFSLIINITFGSTILLKLTERFGGKMSNSEAYIGGWIMAIGIFKTSKMAKKINADQTLKEQVKSKWLSERNAEKHE